MKDYYLHVALHDCVVVCAPISYVILLVIVVCNNYSSNTT